METKRASEIPLTRQLRDCDPDGFVSVADLRSILRCSRSKIDHLTRQGKLRKFYFGGNVRFRVGNVLDIIEEATGFRPDPWRPGSPEVDASGEGSVLGHASNANSTSPDKNETPPAGDNNGEGNGKGVPLHQPQAP
jgi:hypothetical protein